MANLTISEKLAERLKQIAARQQRPVEALLEEFVDKYDDPLYAEVPDDVEDKDAYVQALREVRPKIYAIAREYWQKVSDQERLALTDAELDQQFWLIDPDGVPRFKAEKGNVQLPRDPLEDIVDLFADSELTDMSSTVRETVSKHYRSKMAGEQ